MDDTQTDIPPSLAGPRPEFADGTEAARRSVISPSLTHGMDSDLRRALVARICAMTGQNDLAATYRAEMVGPAYRDVADGGEAGNDPFLAAIVRHTDRVTVRPIDSTAAHITALEDAGLTTPQIVALSELIAFANYHARVHAALALLGAQA